jgi:hypothetical protein
MPSLIKLDLPVEDLSTKKRSHHDAIGDADVVKGGKDNNDESKGVQHHDERNNGQASEIAVAKGKAKAPKDSVKGVNKSKAKKEKKDPNAPKRASGAYIFYQNEIRPAIKIEMPDLGFGDTARIMSERWRVLPNDEKRQYNTMYEEDKKRYEREMIVYTTSLGQSQLVKKGVDEITAKDRLFGGPPESVNVSLYVADYLLECGSAETTVEDAIDTQHTKNKKTSSPYFTKGARSLINSLDASTVNDVVANNVSAATDDEPTIEFEINKENTVGDEDEKIVFEGLGKSIIAMTSKSKSPAKNSSNSSSPNHKPSSTTPTIGGAPRSCFVKVTASDKIIAELDLMKSPPSLKSNQISEKLSVKHVMKEKDDDDQSIVSSSSNDSIWDAGLSSNKTKGRASNCDSGNAGQSRGVADVDMKTSNSGNLGDDAFNPSLIATSAEVTFEIPGSAISIVIAPGRLGLTITTVPGGSFRGARIDAINPVCPFRDEVSVGDTIVAINGKEVTTKADLSVGVKETRKILIIRGATANDRNERTLKFIDEYMKRDFGTKIEAEECLKNLELMTNIVDSGITSIYDNETEPAEDTTNEKVLKSSSKLQSSEQDDFIDDPFTTYAEDTTNEKVLKSSSKLQGSEQDDSIDDPVTPVRSIKLNLIPMTRLDCQKALLANKITYPEPEYLVAGGPSEYDITRATIMLEDKEVVKLGRNDLTNIKWSAVSRELCVVFFDSSIAYVTMTKVAAQHAVFLNGSALNRPVGINIPLKDSDILSLYGPTGFAYQLNLV